MSEGTTIFTAAWVAPMDGPVIRDGGVAVRDGRIVAIGAWRNVQRERPEGQVRYLGNVVLMPGLINAHTHLELSDCSPGERPAGIVPWLERMLSRKAAEKQELAAAAKIGMEQSLRFGVTAVGDITREPYATRPELSKGPLRVVSFGEVRGMAGRRGQLDKHIGAACDPWSESETLSIGISPHSPYSVEAGGYSRCLEMARNLRIPLTTHLAESADEAKFLEVHDGPFRRLWESRLDWTNDVPKFSGGPIRFAKALGLLDYPTILAHLNYCDDVELEILAGGRAHVVWCPRTHAYFGHPPHRWREMLKRGINVAVGTDSTASSPDLNIVEDLRLVHRIAPEAPVQEIWEMATTRAAAVLGQHGAIGVLATGANADIVAFSVDGDDPLLEVLETDAPVAGVWIAGSSV